MVRRSRVLSLAPAILAVLLLVAGPIRLAHASPGPEAGSTGKSSGAPQPQQEEPSHKDATPMGDVLELSIKLRNPSTSVGLLPQMPEDTVPFAGANATGQGRHLLGQTYYRVVIQSAFGSCLAIYDGKDGSNPYSWQCNQYDARQVWYWYPQSGYLLSATSSCLAIYDGNNDSKPYGWRCLSDRRQQWRYIGSSNSKFGMLNSLMGSCLALYTSGNNQKPYGWSCNSGDVRQWWRMVSV